MIRQQVGDLLEVQHIEGVFYVVVLTRVVLFGGNIVFAFHNDGEPRTLESLHENAEGFLVCVDLIESKRQGLVRRIAQYGDVSAFWRTRLMKGTNEMRPGVRANLWFIYDAETHEEVARVKSLSAKHKAAMDYSCQSFDLVASKVLCRYSPDKHPNI
jgi:hypothetical protein